MGDRTEVELQRLRRCLRDVVALSALPSVWTGYGIAQIAAQLGEVVGRTLDVDAVYVRAAGYESTWSARPPDQALCDVLRRTGAAELTGESRLLLADGSEVRLLSNSLSVEGKDRVILAARRSDFPSDNDRLLLRVAANQASTWMERKSAEQALSAETAFRRGIENSMAAGVAAVDLEGRQTYVNRAFARIVGWDESELIGAMPPFVYWAPEEHERIRQVLGQVLAGDVPPGGVELPFCRRDGERFDALVLVSPLEQEGRVSGYLACVYDVTERRAQERAASFLAEASEILSRSLDYQQTLAAISQLAVPRLADWCFVDLVETGGAFERIAAAHADPADAALALRFRRRYAPNPTPAGVSATFAHGRTMVMNDVGDEFVTSVARDDDHRSAMRALGMRCFVSVPMRSRGSTFGVITFVGSRTHRRFEPRDVQLFEELARRAAVAVDNSRLYDEAREASRAKDEFLANVSHELRTPMTAILGWAHLLNLSDLDDRDVRVGISTIRQSAQAQAKLIDDLLDVSRIVAGKLQLNAEPVDLVAVVEEAVAAIRPAAAAKRHALSIAARERPMMVLGDAARLQQVFWNLLSNAVKFTLPGGSIDLRIERAGDSVVASVRDSGEGIPADFLPAVFDRFRQLGKGAQARAGLGIGLAITKELVELHGGTVVAQSAGPGRGATFIVRLPLALADAQAAPSRRDRQDLRLRGVRVLLAEDDETTRTLLSTLLRSFGADVCAARSAAEALELARSFAPQVIVTDIAMPGDDGVALLEKLRADSCAGVPAIALTAYADDANRRRILAAGFDAFISKPVQPADFALAVERLLRAG